jgi:hypothetical protein
MILMWAVAVVVFFCCKAISLIAAKPASLKLKLAYVFLWVGLDANGFLHSESKAPKLSEWYFAFFNTVIGIGLLFVGHALTTIVGIVFLLHFGLFHFLSLAWRMAGFNAKPLMNSPILATSLGDFWGNRWNTAFRDLSQLIFKPIAKKSIPLATFAVFVMSGVLHELVMSVPVGSGYGGPFLYFMIQCAGVFAERKFPIRGRVFTILVVILPLPFLLTQGFVNLFAR